VFMMDTRGHASPIDLEDGPEKTKLGSKQKQVLFEWLLSTNATFKFLSSPVAWSASISKASFMKLDIWSNYMNERDEIFQFIYEHNITGVILMSADLHWSHVIRIHPWLYEFGSSPMQAILMPKVISKKNDEEPLFVLEWRSTFGQMKIIEDPHTKELQLDYSLYGWHLLSNPSPIYQLTLNASTLIPRQFVGDS